MIGNPLIFLCRNSLCKLFELPTHEEPLTHYQLQFFEGASYEDFANLYPFLKHRWLINYYSQEQGRTLCSMKAFRYLQSCAAIICKYDSGNFLLRQPEQLEAQKFQTIKKNTANCLRCGNKKDSSDRHVLDKCFSSSLITYSEEAQNFTGPAAEPFLLI